MHLSHGPKKGDIFDITIDTMSVQGLGESSLSALVGPQKEEKNYQFFVKKAVPGDVVRVKVEQARRRRVSATIVEFLQPSKMRIEPRCQHFGIRKNSDTGCGGCTLQSLSYRHQLAIKERTIKSILMNHGIDSGLVFPVLGMDDPWYYRNKMEFSFSDTSERSFGLGLHPSGFKYEVINLKHCFLQSEFVSTILPIIRQWAINSGLQPVIRTQGFLRNLTFREGKRTGDIMVELTTSTDEYVSFNDQQHLAEDVARIFCEFMVETSEALGQPIKSFYWTQYKNDKGSPTKLIEHLLYGNAVYREELHLFDDLKLQFEVHPRAFFQPNPAQAEQIYRTAIECTGLRNTLNKKANVLDLYCGTGTIGLCVAPYSQSVIGMELQPDAVDNARKNAELNNIDNIEFYVGDVGKLLNQPDIQQKMSDIDVVIVDPPRSGLLPEACAQLQQINAPTIVYVSCNPVSLAKNLVDLQSYGYTIESIQPIDMFPHTYHVENVVLLRRKS